MNGIIKYINNWITHFTISLHSIFSFFSTFLILQTIPLFFNFPNPYTISLNLNHSYHLEISKVKPFLHYFSKPIFTIPNHFQTIFSIPINGMEWAKCPPQTRGWSFFYLYFEETANISKYKGRFGF